MQLINLTQKQTITKQLVIAKSWLDATIGLLNRPQGTAMLFKTRWGIHTFGMKYPIDILILNNQFEIVSIRRLLYPNRVFFWNPKYSTLIELPSNNLKSDLGDLLGLKK